VIEQRGVEISEHDALETVEYPALRALQAV